MEASLCTQINSVVLAIDTNRLQLLTTRPPGHLSLSNDCNVL